MKCDQVVLLSQGAAPEVVCERGEHGSRGDGHVSNVSLARRQHHRQHRRRRQSTAAEGAPLRLQGL